MKIQLNNLWDLKEIAKKPFEEHTTWIAVTLGVAEWKDFDYKPQNILEVDLSRFVPEEDDDSKSELWFDTEQAEEIAAFIKQHLDETEVLICQSVPYVENDFAVAVAAAVEDYLLQDDGKRFLENGCAGGYRDIYKMLKDALAGRPLEYGAVMEEKEDVDFIVKVREINTDELG